MTIDDLYAAQHDANNAVMRMLAISNDLALDHPEGIINKAAIRTVSDVTGIFGRIQSVVDRIRHRLEIPQPEGEGGA